MSLEKMFDPAASVDKMYVFRLWDSSGGGVLKVNMMQRLQAMKVSGQNYITGCVIVAALVVCFAFDHARHCEVRLTV